MLAQRLSNETCGFYFLVLSLLITRLERPLRITRSEDASLQNPTTAKAVCLWLFAMSVSRKNPRRGNQYMPRSTPKGNRGNLTDFCPFCRVFLWEGRTPFLFWTLSVMTRKSELSCALFFVVQVNKPISSVKLHPIEFEFGRRAVQASLLILYQLLHAKDALWEG